MSAVSNPVRQPLAVKHASAVGCAHTNFSFASHANVQPGAAATGGTVKLTDTTKNTTTATSMGKADTHSHLKAALEHAFSRGTAVTPKKRAVPVEDVHFRNVPSPAKRSRPSPHKPPSSSRPDESGAPNAAKGAESAPAAGTAPAVPGPSTSTTAQQGSVRSTVRIDKYDRTADDHERAAKLEAYNARMQREEEWRQKYAKAFPAFVFYLDSLDPGVAKGFVEQVRSLGGQIDSFFSRKVTHIVTTRSVPKPNVAPAADKENVAVGHATRKPQPGVLQQLGTSILGSRARNRTLPKTRHSPSKFVAGAASKNVPVHSDRNPFDEPSGKDFLQKAREFGTKIWSPEKLHTVLSRLRVSVPTPEKGKQPDLSNLLREEKLNGTRERDPNAPRSDYYYFPKSSCYLMVEDATGRHRPIILQEYEKPREGQDPEWPQLYGHLEGRCPFSRFDVPEDYAYRQHQRNLRVNTRDTLRRTVSLNHFHYNLASTHGKGGYQPFLAASGNSVHVTSAIGSTTSIRSGVMPAPGGTPGLNGFGLPQDKRVTQLGRRVHVSLPPRAQQVPAIHGRSGTTSGSGSTGAGSHLQVPEDGKSVLVHRMLELAAEGKAAPSPAAAAAVAGGGRSSRAASVAPQDLEYRPMMRKSRSANAVPFRRDEPKKPGYCENCRVKFEDFDEHVQGKRHRKFATDPTKFASIDELLARVRRPMLPLSAASCYDGDGSAYTWEIGDASSETSPDDHVPDDHVPPEAYSLNDENCELEYEEDDDGGEDEEALD